jgi:hypothetical protein
LTVGAEMQATLLGGHRAGISMDAVFLGSARCFHTMDWFRSCCELAESKPLFVTDNYAKEGFKPLLRSSDAVGNLFILDPLLPNRPTAMGHRWRNLLKLAVVPLQVLKLKRLLRKLPQPFVFAHSTYYAFLASFCGVPYSATPQGSEVLVRPKGSRFYRYLLKRSVKYASFVTVDSVAMSREIERLTGVVPLVIQNGIDMRRIAAAQDCSARTVVASVRGISSNYRIVEIIRARDASSPTIALDFSFPFVEEGYARQVQALLGVQDVMHRDLSRDDLYRLFKRAICVVSIPASDSSPRSVYEAIFCGAVAICSPSPYVDRLPDSMRRRIILADLSDPRWFAKCCQRARELVAESFLPDEEAMLQFDQIESMRRCLSLARARLV